MPDPTVDGREWKALEPHAADISIQRCAMVRILQLICQEQILQAVTVDVGYSDRVARRQEPLGDVGDSRMDPIENVTPGGSEARHAVGNFAQEKSGRGRVE